MHEFGLGRTVPSGAGQLVWVPYALRGGTDCGGVLLYVMGYGRSTSIAGRVLLVNVCAVLIRDTEQQLFVDVQA